MEINPAFFDPFGGYEAGRQAYNQNALRGVMAQNAEGLMNGDQNALAQVAQYDPGLAFEISRGQRQDARADRSLALQERQAEQSMQNDNERMQLARQAGQQSAAEFAAKMDDRQKAEVAGELTRMGQAASVAYQGGEQSWGSFLASNAENLPEELRGLSYGDAPAAIAWATGVTEGLTGGGATTATQTLTERATLGGLQPGTPEFQDYMLNGGVERTQTVNPTFRPATPEEATQYGSKAGQIDDATGRFYPAESKDSTTEGERKNAGFYQRMKYAEDEYNKLPPSGQRHNMAQGALIGLGVPEGWALTGEEERGRQFQIDWVRAKLRAESGAVIGEQEAWEEAATYFPRPGDGPERIKAKGESRQTALEQMRLMAGREADGSVAGAPTQPQDGPPQEIMQQLQGMPAGTQVQGPNGEVLTWDGQSLVRQ